MKILIAADMEGITGVVHWDQVNINHPEYARFRRLMTQDVNAAVRGAFEGGADEVTVTDGHHYGRNILIEELDPRATLNSGSPSPISMIEGVDRNVQGLMFVGYHARIGAQNATLDHTWSDERVFNLWINDRLVGETALNAGLAGHFEVPLVMISGDYAVCTEAQAWVNGVETAVVKVATGRMSAECLPPAQSHPVIQSAARRAVQKLLNGAAPAPLRFAPPIRMLVEFIQSEMADRAALLPGASRQQDRQVAYTAEDMRLILQAFRAMLSLARG